MPHSREVQRRVEGIHLIVDREEKRREEEEKERVEKEAT
jgi:hypothetical protein